MGEGGRILYVAIFHIRYSFFSVDESSVPSENSLVVSHFKEPAWNVHILELTVTLKTKHF